MKIAVVGKGGAGKTTTSAILARAFAQRGEAVIALDCDTNPNLGIALGFGAQRTSDLISIREALDDDEAEHAPSIAELMKRFGSDGPGGVRLAVVSKIERPNPG